MRAVLVVGLLAGAVTPVHAQAPGQIVPVAEPSVMDRRWSVSLSFGTLGLAPDRDDADSVSFGMAELAGRFRIRSFVDVGLSLYGAGAGEGELSSGGIY